MRHFHARSGSPSMTASSSSSVSASPRRHEDRGLGEGVTIITSDATRAAFPKGTPLIQTAAYKVHASRRKGPGTAEVHARDMDIFYVLEGSATLVTGGRPVDAKATAPDRCEPRRWRAARRGPSQREVVIVQNGVRTGSRKYMARSYYAVKVPTAASATGAAR